MYMDAYICTYTYYTDMKDMLYSKISIIRIMIIKMSGLI